MSDTLDVENEVKELLEPENLDDVDLGLPDKSVLEVAASERRNNAVSCQILRVRLSTVKASKIANRSVGNEKEAKKYEEEENILSGQISHCLRGIKEIDRKYPNAKKLMQEMMSKEGK